MIQGVWALGEVFLKFPNDGILGIIFPFLVIIHNGCEASDPGYSYCVAALSWTSSHRYREAKKGEIVFPVNHMKNIIIQVLFCFVLFLERKEAFGGIK